ncbi:hypothetical protein QBC41DRAFT_235195, partial [Cercophora samala]
KKNIKKVAYNKNNIIIYNNFNFKNRIKKLINNKQNQIINLTTTLLINYPKLNRPFY